ncbi:MAG: sigma-70 family RNA polymerase sigma factor [Ruminococcaceae bacterium]|nr:sigma-70 family RNA polymerase sigma factor [Oscillospiraceae bacterium]
MELQKQTSPRTPLPDEAIVTLYWNRDETAIEETDFKYKNYLFSVIRNLLNDPMDCEECLNDTYLGTWNAIPPTKPAVLKAFLTTVARRAAIKRYHKARKKTAIPSELTVSLSELEEFLSDGGEAEPDFDAAALGKVISEFLYSLDKRKRYIFMSRYYVAVSIEKIARELKVSRSTVNKELAAIRKSLKAKLESEGYRL